MTRYSFPENLKKARQEHGITQKELAEKVGVAQCTLCSWENNYRYPTIDKVYDLANALSIPTNALVEATVETTV